MKKRICLLLALLLIFSLTACGIDQEVIDTAAELIAESLAEEAAAEEAPAAEPEAAEEAADDTEQPAEEAESAGEAPEAEAEAEPETTEAEPEAAEEAVEEPEQLPAEEDETLLDEDGVYDSRDEVALYIHLYGHLPSNYITKSEAEALGWPGGSLEPYAPGKCIGGSRFGNYEGILPDADGRSWTECDIDTLGARSRGAKRIVFSNDGLIYYTDDHYETFTLLYGEE